MVFYTDGLVERRGEPLEIGLERLRAAASSASPRQVAHTIMHDLVGNTDPEDDVALLVMRTSTS